MLRTDPLSQQTASNTTALLPVTLCLDVNQNKDLKVVCTLITVTIVRAHVGVMWGSFRWGGLSGL